jgi:hypothetical protein
MRMHCPACHKNIGGIAPKPGSPKLTDRAKSLRVARRNLAVTQASRYLAAGRRLTTSARRTSHHPSTPMRWPLPETLSITLLSSSLAVRRQNALEHWRLTWLVEPNQFRLRVLILHWPTASFDQPSERLLRLVADVRIEKSRSHRFATIRKKVR